MLEILRIRTPETQFELLDRFVDRVASGEEVTWILSDLRSKFEIQNRLMARNGCFVDTQVLRASDFWRALLKRVHPDVRIVSRDFAKIVVRSFLDEHRDVLGDRRNSEAATLAAMDQFAGIVFHPRGQELMTEWFDGRPDSKNLWGEDYLLARLALGYFHSKNMALAKWVPALLSASEQWETMWKTPIIVDLGAELTGPESQLFLRLSKEIDVTFLEPAPDWSYKEEPLLKPYQDLHGWARVKTEGGTREVSGHRVRVMRMASQLSEVQKAVGQVRQWLEEGTPAHQIALLAPDMETYWPVLQSYLAVEGIPVDKPVAYRLSGLWSVQKWISRLKAKTGELRFADVETVFYSTPESEKVRYENFQALLANFYEMEDLTRLGEIAAVFKEPADFRERMSRDGFLSASLSLWDPGDDIEAFVLACREVMKNAPASTEFSVADWVQYVQVLLTNLEVTEQAAAAGGVFVDNFQSARMSGFRKRIFLGLSDEAIKKSEPHALPLQDVAGLAQIGFHLSHPDISVRDFELRWLLDEPCEDDVLMVSHAAFDGSVLTPSLLWIERHEQITDAMDDIAVAAARWNRLQENGWDALRSERGWSAGQSDSMAIRLRADLDGRTELPAAKVPGDLALSPSSLKSYLDCPFKFAATKIFRLKDLEERDLDLARTDLGILSHALFQDVTELGWVEKNVTDEEIVAQIDVARERMNLVLSEPKWWPSLRAKLVRSVRSFLSIEKEWRARFPDLKAVHHEKEWKVYFDPADEGFHSTAADGRIEIRGRIDRLEESKDGRFVVVDYKSSANSLYNHGKWISKNDLQLLFYMWALEKGAVEGLQGRVIGAFYYVFKDFSRNMGMQIREESGVLFEAAARKSQKDASDADKGELLTNLEDAIRGAVRGMKENRLDPRPLDETECRRCHWKGLCRASHLNQ